MYSPVAIYFIYVMFKSVLSVSLLLLVYVVSY